MSAFMPSVHWHFRLPTLHHPEASSLRRCQGPAWCVRTVCLMGRSDDACTSAHLPSHTIQGPGPSSTSRGRLAPSSAVTSLSSLGEAAWAMASAKNTGLFNHWACLTFFLIRKKKTFESFYLKFKCSPYMHLPVSQKEKWKMPGKHKLRPWHQPVSWSTLIIREAVEMTENCLLTFALSFLYIEKRIFF